MGSEMCIRDSLKIIPIPKNFREVVVKVVKIRITLNHLPMQKFFFIGDAVVRNFVFVNILHRHLVILLCTN